MIVVARQPNIAAIHTFLAKTPTPPSGQTRAGCDPPRSRCVPARLLILPRPSRPYGHSGGIPSVELPATAASPCSASPTATQAFFLFSPEADRLRHPREQKQKWLIKRGKTSQPDVGGLNPLCHFSSAKHLNTLHAALAVLH